MSSLIKTTSNVPLPNTVEATMRILERVLNKPFVQRVLIDLDTGIEVVWKRAMGDSLDIKEEVEPSISTLVKRIDIEEVSGEVNNREVWFEAMKAITYSSLEPVFIICHEVGRFKEWMGLDKLFKLPTSGTSNNLRFAGLEVIEDIYLNEDVILICASKSNYGAPSLNSVELGIKITMETEDGQ